MSYIGSQKYINWSSIVDQSPELQKLLSEENLTYCQKEITRLLKGVHPEGRDIIVTKRSISALLFSIYDEHVKTFKQVGDIYSRYVLPIELHRDDLSRIVDKTIRTIVNTERTEYETIRNNQRITVWNTMYGDFNQEGLRAHSTIKLRERRPAPLQFHMNY